MLLFALLIGFVAGLRAMTAPAAVAFAARYGGLHLAGAPLASMGWLATPVSSVTPASCRGPAVGGGGAASRAMRVRPVNPGTRPG